MMGHDNKADQRYGHDVFDATSILITEQSTSRLIGSVTLLPLFPLLIVWHVSRNHLTTMRNGSYSLYYTPVLQATFREPCLGPLGTL